MEKKLVLILFYLCSGCGISLKSTKFINSAKLSRVGVFIYFTEDLLSYSEGISQELKDSLSEKNIPVSVDLIYTAYAKDQEQQHLHKLRRDSVLNKSIDLFNPDQILLIYPTLRTFNGGILESANYNIVIFNMEEEKLWEGKMFIATTTADKM